MLPPEMVEIYWLQEVGQRGLGTIVFVKELHFDVFCCQYAECRYNYCAVYRCSCLATPSHLNTKVCKLVRHMWTIPAHVY